MKRLLSLIAAFALVISLGMTATAHAMERPDVVPSAHATEAQQAAEGHTVGDADQVPADGDKGYPHHHGGCHGDHVAAPIKAATASAQAILRVEPFASVRSIRVLATTDPALRPPQA